MNKILILAEGETEKQFINTLLSPYLLEKTQNGLYAVASQLVTRRDKNKGRQYQGGGVNLERVKREIKHLLGDSSATLVTTMFDLYGLGDDFWELISNTKPSRIEQVHELSQKCEDLIGDRRFLAYFSMHEFEALLFSEPDKIYSAFPNAEKEILANLQKIRTQFATPEDINHDSPPSHRIMRLYDLYRKTKHGIEIAQAIGIPTLRQHCPHFHGWLHRLESIGVT